jgi:hypothetical protein
MYAGQGVKAFNDLYQFDNFQKIWVPIPQNNNLNTKGRHGHCMLGYRDKLFIFGGKIYK